MMHTFDRIRDIILDVSGTSEKEIKAESSLVQLNLDTLDVAEVIMDVEEEFDILVEDESEICTVNDLVTLVNAQRATV